MQSNYVTSKNHHPPQPLNTQDSHYQIRNCIFAYKCEADWETLEDTNKEKIRLFHACEKEVHFCEDDKELTNAIRDNFCVAFERVEKNRTFKFIGLIRPDSK